jgi:hypothetical protein
LIRRKRSVALDELDAIEGYRQFFGHQLSLSRVESVTQFTLPGVGSDRTVRIDGEPAIELIAAGAVEPLG